MKLGLKKLISVIGTLLIISIFLPSEMTFAGQKSDFVEVLDPSQTISPLVIESEELKLSIRYGAFQQARYGRKLVITADVTSKTLQGQYTLNLYFGNSQNENIKYGMDCILEEGETTTVQFTIPMIREILKLKAELVNEKKETVVEEVKSFRVTNFGPYKLAGILTDLSDEMSYYSSFGNKYYYMNKSNFPSDKDGLDIFDVIIVNDFDCNELSEEQVEALIGYVKTGGLLAIGTGKNVDNLACFVDHGIIEINGIDASEKLKDIPLINKTITIGDDTSFSKLLQAITTYENNRIKELNRMEERNKNYGVDIRSTYVGDSMVTGSLLSELEQETLQKDIAKFKVKNASNILMDGEVLLFQKLLFGEGDILIANFDLGITNEQSKTSINTAYIQIANLIYSNVSGNNQQKIETESYGSVTNLNNYGAIGTTNSGETPVFHVYFVILICYVVIVGPVTFVILKRIEKSKYLWCVVPALSVIFIFIIFGVGSKTRITKPYVSYLSIERYDGNTKQVNGEVAFQISFPTNKDSELKFKNINLLTTNKVSFPGYSTYYNDKVVTKNPYIDLEAYGVGVHYKEDEVILESLNTPAFSSNSLYSSYSYEGTPLVKGNLSVNELGVNGVVTNTSGTQIEDAFIYSNGFLVSLGTLEDGASVQVQDYPREYFMNVDMTYYSDLMEGILEYDENNNVIPESSWKNQALRGVVEELKMKEDKSYFIAISEDASVDNPIQKLTLNRGSYGVNVSITPLDVIYSHSTSTFVPSIDRYMNVLDGENQYIYNFRYMINNVITMEYYLPAEENITGVMVSELYNTLLEKENSSTICNQIYFYNYKSESYDLVFDLRKMEKSNNKSGDELAVLEVPENELEQYLSNNVLKVKYDSNTDLENISILPIISYRKEEPYAAN